MAEPSDGAESDGRQGAEVMREARHEKTCAVPSVAQPFAKSEPRFRDVHGTCGVGPLSRENPAA